MKCNLFIFTNRHRHVQMSVYVLLSVSHIDCDISSNNNNNSINLINFPQLNANQCHLVVVFLFCCCFTLPFQVDFFLLFWFFSSSFKCYIFFLVVMFLNCVVDIELHRFLSDLFRQISWNSPRRLSSDLHCVLNFCFVFSLGSKGHTRSNFKFNGTKLRFRGKCVLIKMFFFLF